MKRIDHDYQSKTLPAVFLYRDDLDYVVELMRQTRQKVTIKDDEYEYDSLEEVAAQRGPRIKKLELTTGSTSVDFSTIFVHLNEGSSENRAVALRLEKFLRDKQRFGLGFPWKTKGIIILCAPMVASGIAYPATRSLPWLLVDPLNGGGLIHLPADSRFVVNVDSCVRGGARFHDVPRLRGSVAEGLDARESTRPRRSQSIADIRIAPFQR